MGTKAYLIIDSTEHNTDLFYRTNFFAPDPVIYIEDDGEKILALNDLEIERGRKEATVDSVLSMGERVKKIKKKRKTKRVGLIDIVEAIFKERKLKTAVVQGSFPSVYMEGLRKKGFKVKIKKGSSLYESSRLRKTDKEVDFIKKALRDSVNAMNIAIGMIAASKVQGNFLMLEGKRLSSERVKGTINSYLAERGYTASHTIVAGGSQGAMPHNTGMGPLLANFPVVIDIFPKSQSSGYYGDISRTVVKGKPTDRLVKMYNTVLKGQKMGIGMVKDGVDGREIHRAILKFFKLEGFETAINNGKPEGFIHSTGHGLGLDIHEPPRIGNAKEILREGNVVTVEPGLYYEDIGGVRIEDVVLVTKTGCVNLTKCKKVFRV